MKHCHLGVDIIYARPFRELPDVALLRSRHGDCLLGAVTAALAALALAAASKASDEQLSASFAVASELVTLMFRRDSGGLGMCEAVEVFREVDGSWRLFQCFSITFR